MSTAQFGWVVEVKNGTVLILLTDSGLAAKPESNGPDVALGDFVLTDDATFEHAPATLGHMFIQVGKVDDENDDGWTIVSNTKFGNLRIPHATDVPYTAGDVVEFRPGKGVTRVLTKQADDDTSEFLVHPGDYPETYDDIVGHEDDIATMNAVIDLLLDPAETTGARGALFTGPPGTGKTMFARALVNETPVKAFYYLRGPEITSKWVNESEERLRRLFDHASKHHDSAIIFIDEIDTIAGVRSTMSHNQDNKFVGQLLSLMTPGGEGRVLVIGATNRAGLLDHALRRQGRFSTRISFGLPDVAARFGILNKTLPAALTDAALLAHFADATAGWNSADIAGIADQVKLVVRTEKRTYATTEDVFLAHEKVANTRATTEPTEGPA